MPRFRTAAVAAVATSLLLIPTAAYAHPDDHNIDSTELSANTSRLAYDSSSGSLTDLNTTVASALDGASASASMFALGLGTVVYLKVKDVSLAAEGQRFGAHLHAGPCVTDNPSAALGHYNTDLLAGISPAVVSQKTEVWLDFRVSDIGEGRSTAPVPFVPASGERSIVIHAQPTMDNGSAGARIACLPFTIE